MWIIEFAKVQSLGAKTSYTFSWDKPQKAVELLCRNMLQHDGLKDLKANKYHIWRLIYLIVTRRWLNTCSHRMILQSILRNAKAINIPTARCLKWSNCSGEKWWIFVVGFSCLSPYVEKLTYSQTCWRYVKTGRWTVCVMYGCVISILLSLERTVSLQLSDIWRFPILNMNMTQVKKILS